MQDQFILLVEDNPDDEDLSVRAIRKNNISNRVEVAHDGVEAVDFLFGTGPHLGRDVRHLPNLILLDLNLPRLNGIEVLKRIRSDPRTRLLPVVILTSSIEEKDLIRSYGFGANSYIRKPVDFNEFMEAVRQLGSYWLSLNQPLPIETIQ